MGTILENYNLLKVNQEKTENIKNPITTKDIISIVKYLPTKKILSPVVSPVNSIKHSRINGSNLYKLPGSRKRGNTSQPIYNASKT